MSTQRLAREQLVEQRWSELCDAEHTLQGARDGGDAEVFEITAARRRLTECGLAYVMAYVALLQTKPNENAASHEPPSEREAPASAMGVAIVHFAQRLRASPVRLRCVARRTVSPQRSVDERNRATAHHLWLHRPPAATRSGDDDNDDDDATHTAEDALLAQCGLLIGTQRSDDAAAATTDGGEAPRVADAEEDDARRRRREAVRRDEQRLPPDLRAPYAPCVHVGGDGGANGADAAEWWSVALRLCTFDMLHAHDATDDEAETGATSTPRTWPGVARVEAEARRVCALIGDHARAQRDGDEHCELLRGTGVQCMRTTVDARRWPHTEAALRASIARALPMAEQCVIGALHEQLTPVAYQFFGTSKRGLAGAQADAPLAWFDVYTVQLRRYVVATPAPEWLRDTVARVAPGAVGGAAGHGSADVAGGDGDERLRAWVSDATLAPLDELSGVNVRTLQRYVDLRGGDEPADGDE